MVGTIHNIVAITLLCRKGSCFPFLTLPTKASQQETQMWMPGPSATLWAKGLSYLLPSPFPRTLDSTVCRIKLKMSNYWGFFNWCNFFKTSSYLLLVRFGLKFIKFLLTFLPHKIDYEPAYKRSNQFNKCELVLKKCTGLKDTKPEVTTELQHNCVTLQMNGQATCVWWPWIATLLSASGASWRQLSGRPGPTHQTMVPG